MKQSLLSLDLGPPDKPIVGGGDMRSYSGNVLEEIVKNALCLHPGIANGQASTCPDAFTPTSTMLPVEIKSLRRRNKMVVYDWRMKKEARHCLYFIGIHKRRPGARSLADLWRSFSTSLLEVYILTAREVEEIALMQPLNKIGQAKTKSGQRNGYQRKGYKDGYRNVPFSALLPRLLLLPFRVSASLHSLPFSFSIRISREALHLTNNVQEKES
jgi:hypothetical protein